MGKKWIASLSIENSSQILNAYVTCGIYSQVNIDKITGKCIEFWILVRLLLQYNFYIDLVNHYITILYVLIGIVVAP